MHNYFPSLLVLENGAAGEQNMLSDMLLTKLQERDLLGESSTEQGLTNIINLWPDGVVPYATDHNLSKLLYDYSV